MSLSRAKDTDYEIMYKLDDRELGRLCSTDTYFRELCKNDTFWRNRSIQRFGKYLRSVEIMNNFRKQYKFPDWRSYYISLVDFLQKELYHHYSLIRSNIRRKDLRILAYYIEENMEKLENEVRNNFYEYKWKNLLKLDLINPNDLLNFRNSKESIEIYDYVLSSDDERVDPNTQLDALVYLETREDPFSKVLAQKLVRHPKVKIQQLINAVLSYQYAVGVHGVIDVYLDFLKEVDMLKYLIQRLKTFEFDKYIYILSHVYEHFGMSSLPEILEILAKEQFPELKYVEILALLENDEAIIRI